MIISCDHKLKESVTLSFPGIYRVVLAFLARGWYGVKLRGAHQKSVIRVTYPAGIEQRNGHVGARRFLSLTGLVVNAVSSSIISRRILSNFPFFSLQIAKLPERP